MTTFSFRAECQADLDAFLDQCRLAQIAIDIVRQDPDSQLPDVAIEATTETTIETLLELMNKVEDGHVMRQTLRECPLRENDLKRNYDL